MNRLKTRAAGHAIHFATAILLLFVGSFVFGTLAEAYDSPGNDKRRNVILIFADDQGYGDLGCFGSKLVKTPHIDRLAEHGMKFTNFYSAASVCTPSRAALLTGCYPERVGNLPVLFPNSDRGLNPDEQTVAELLQAAGYRTACFGKWHLGHHPPFLPTQQGFDEYFGVPYSNDMNIDGSMRLADKVTWRDQMNVEKFKSGKSNGPPIMQGSKEKGCQVIECPADQTTLTQRYTEQVIRFIGESKKADKPFFIYLPHTMPHIPLYASDNFRGKSDAGLYGDTLEEMDASVGQIVEKLRQEELTENTLIIYTSDNGPWNLRGSPESWVKGNMKRNVGGSAGPLRGYKFSQFEGGMREPTVIWGPGLVAAGKVCDHVTSTIDVLPTLVELAGAKLPAKTIDGKSMVRILQNGNQAKPIREVYFYRTAAVRSGNWKLKGKQLFNLEQDISESKDVAADQPEIVQKLNSLLADHRAELKQNARKAGEYVRSEQIIKDLPNWRAKAGKWKFNQGVLANGNDQSADLVYSQTIPEKDFTFEIKARRTGGKEGFRILLRANRNQSICWSVGAFGNTKHSLMRVQRNQVKKRNNSEKSKIENDRWYQLRVEVSGNRFKCYVDGELVNEDTFNWNRAGMIGLGSHQASVEFKDPKLTAGKKVLLTNWQTK